MGATCSRGKNAVSPLDTRRNSQIANREDNIVHMEEVKSCSPTLLPIGSAAATFLYEASSFASLPASPKAVSRMSGKSRQSSTSTISAIYSGAWEMMSVTDYEKSIVTILWQEIIMENEYWCEGVYYRLFDTHPDFKQLFGIRIEVGRPQSVSNQAEHLLLRNRARELKELLDHLILQLKLDTEECIVHVQALGERHVDYIAPLENTKKTRHQQPIDREYWKYFTQAFNEEIDSTLQSTDVEEREMQKISWNHFFSGIVGTLKQSYEEEFWRQVAAESEDESDSPTAVGRWVSKAISPVVCTKLP